MSDIEIERKAFEKSLSIDCRTADAMTLERERDGSYSQSLTRLLWKYWQKAWQAAKQDVGEWVKTSERLPKHIDADDDGRIYVFFNEKVLFVEFDNFDYLIDESYTHWMAKPKSTAPQPPRVQS